MAGSLNRVTLIGFLGRDPEVRHTRDGRPIINMSIATSETWKDKSTGERREKTSWHNIVIFSEGLCKIAEQYLKKGSRVFLEGALQTRKWQDQSGQDRYSTEVVLQGFDAKIIMLSKSEGSGDRDDYRDEGSGQSKGQAKPAATGGGTYDDFDQEIPFAPEFR